MAPSALHIQHVLRSVADLLRHGFVTEEDRARLHELTRPPAAPRAEMGQTLTTYFFPPGTFHVSRRLPAPSDPSTEDWTGACYLDLCIDPPDPVNIHRDAVKLCCADENQIARIIEALNQAIQAK